MPIPPSNFPVLLRASSEPPEELVEKVVRRLQTTGELMRLAAFIPGRLSELGWCDRVMELCREYIRNHSASGPGIKTGSPPGTGGLKEPSEVSVDDMVRELTPNAKYWVPEELYKQLKYRIMEFIGEQGLD
ncbi:hypothetical protein CSKR_105599 [Clonorchis sinensis]|uniref:Uncharacterized protein n=2 Tax=Clonorchis sinensis TaxID=79923 RepID=A0A8T1MNV3_CLOSI|nr:hypothetical protein CSKR_105599 [Clonorchis sinensis]GAA53301.1 enhancer of yellow 2 transcription factor [Clonorchis sinensis]